jgi:hypothetical protein
VTELANVATPPTAKELDAVMKPTTLSVLPAEMELATDNVLLA